MYLKRLSAQDVSSLFSQVLNPERGLWSREFRVKIYRGFMVDVFQSATLPPNKVPEGSQRVFWAYQGQYKLDRKP